MAASYPGSVRVFTIKTNVVDIIDASHPDVLQDEVAAVQTTLGVNPHVSSTPNPAGTFVSTGQMWASVAARLANIETGIVSDTHAQYLHIAGGDTMQGATAGTVVHRIRARGDQAAALQRIESSDGTTVYLQVTTGGVAMSAATVGGAPVLTSVPFGAVVSEQGWGQAPSDGSGTAAARANHTHGTPPNPVTTGNVVAQTGFGMSSSNGTGTALALASHTHGTPPNPVVFGGVVAETSWGQSAQIGTTGASSDAGHSHGTPPAPVTGFGVGARTGNVTATAADVGPGTYPAGDYVYPGKVTATQHVGQIIPIPLHFPTVTAGLSRTKFIATTNMTLKWAYAFAETTAGATYQLFVNGAQATPTSAATSITASTLNDFTDVDIAAGDRVAVNFVTAAGVELSLDIHAVTR